MRRAALLLAILGPSIYAAALATLCPLKLQGPNEDDCEPYYCYGRMVHTTGSWDFDCEPRLCNPPGVCEPATMDPPDDAWKYCTPCEQTVGYCRLEFKGPAPGTFRCKYRGLGSCPVATNCRPIYDNKGTLFDDTDDVQCCGCI